MSMRSLRLFKICLLEDVAGDFDAIAEAFLIEYVANVVLDRPNADL